MSEMIKLKSAGDGFEFAALHEEAHGHRKGGIVIIQEIFGVDKYVEEDVARWAGKGFEALAPSMFDRQKPGFIAGHDPEGMQEGMKFATENGVDNPVWDVQACVDYLKPHGPVFIVGYCYGGWIAWEAAGQVTDLSAASSYYGGRIKDRADLKLSCPIICHFGRKDGHIDADAYKSAIRKAHPHVPVYIYDHSGHGFNNDGRPDSDARDAELARKRSVEFFEAHGAT